MDLYEAMHTTFAAREFTDAAVSDDTIHRLLDHARFAPSGGNRQGWRVVVIRDPATRERFAEWVGPPMQRYVAQTAAGECPWNTVVPSRVDPETVARTPAPPIFAEAIRTAPVLLLVCVDLSLTASVDSELDRIGVVTGASVYPFVWNLLLAARAEGLGGTIMTMLAPSEPAVQELLGLPPSFAVSALIPIGRPVRQLTKLKRHPVEQFARLERWDGPRLLGG